MKIKPNKTASLLFMFMFFFQGINSQDYLITFSGSGQSNTVESVEVKNIDQQETLILSGTDTLHLLHNVGVGHLNSVHENMIIYPNPADHECRLELHQTGPGKVNIEIYDISGRLSMSNSIQLTAGMHAFTISGLKAGIYLVKVKSPKHTYSRRLLSASSFNSMPDIRYDGIVQDSKAARQLKRTSNMVAMQYNEGERLVFKAISGDYAHTKSLVPIKSQDIDFEFIDCIDGDGNHYGVVSIGEQIWMAENLKTQKDAAGNNITRYCYDNNTDYCSWYGGLYLWSTLMNGDGSSNSNPSGVQGICPTGWHVPSDAEWTQLVDYVVAQGYPNNDVTNGAGNALKSCRQENSPLGGDCNTTVHPRWNSNLNHHGFDLFGFAMFPGGFRSTDGNYLYLGVNGYPWSSSENSSMHAWGRYIYHIYGHIHRNTLYKTGGFSIRCLRD